MSDPFHAYMKRSGCEEALWRALIELDKMKDTLDDPIEFLRLNLDKELNVRYETLKRQIAEAREEVLRISEENPDLFAKYLKMKKKKAKRGQILPIEKVFIKEADKSEDIKSEKGITEEEPSEFHVVIPPIVIEEIPEKVELIPPKFEEVPPVEAPEMVNLEAEQSDQILSEAEVTDKVDEPKSESIIFAESLNERATNKQYQNAFHQEGPLQSDLLEVSDNLSVLNNVGSISTNPDKNESESKLELEDAAPESCEKRSETHKNSVSKETLSEKRSENRTDEPEEKEKVKKSKFLCC